MDACLSFTTVSIFTDTDTYTDHGHGSQFTDLWMASFTTVSNFTDADTYTDHGHGSQITDIWMASLNYIPCN